MAGIGGGVKATILVLLLVLSSMLSTLEIDNHEIVVLDYSNDSEAYVGPMSKVTILDSNTLANGPALELHSSHAVQSLDLTIKSSIDLRSTSFKWDDWNVQGATNTGLVEDTDGALILGFQGIDWTFDNNNNGWTSSNSQYAQHNTALTCGMNGGTGGSWWTRGSSVTATSPVTNLIGFQGLSLQAWVMQGNFQCGEEADTNEDFYLEYRRSNNQWGQIQSFSGSTPGGTGSITNVNFVLPSDAYHANFQVRGRQTSGSGPSFDYWFFDDISVPGTAGANFTTQSFGWGNNVNQVIEEGKYPPMYLDAKIPSGSEIKWTVLDANSGNPVSGLIDRSGKYIDLSVVDWKLHDALRLELDFMANKQGESPRLYSISGGGSISDKFHSSPLDNGWSFQGSNWIENSKSIKGGINDTVISPIFDINLPIGAYEFQSVYSGVTPFISIDGGNFSEISSSQNIVQFEKSVNTIQIMYRGISENWRIDEISLEMIPTNLPLHPVLDVDLDGRPEWSVNNADIGYWGLQDVFASSGTSKLVQVGFTPSSMHNILIPRDATDFEVSANDVGSTGLGIQTLALWVGNQMISQTGGTGYSAGLHLDLNESEIEILNLITDTSAPVMDLGGKLYVLGKIELIADAGTHELAGLYIPYEAKQEVKATAFDELVMSINRVRLDQSLSSYMNLKFSANNSCVIEVSLDGMTSSGDATLFQHPMGPVLFENDSSTITPSHKWREMMTRTQIHTSSPYRLIVNMYSDDYAGQWFIPINEGNIISVGDSDKLIFSDEGISTAVSGKIYDLNLPFRTAQSFDDQQNLRIESRIQLLNGFVSMPAIKSWNNQAVENDIMIRSFEIISDSGLVPNYQTYLKAAEDLTMIVDLGFENLDTDDKPYPGEFLMELRRDGDLVANTTWYDGYKWYVNTTTPFTSGDVSWVVSVNPLQGGGSSSQTEINRTFNIDPLSPVVVGANIRSYDHRTSSQSQLIEINITDQPVLPKNVTMMLWMEWANDIDGDGWPSADEFVERNLQRPSTLDSTYGNYHTIIDDTPGYVGEKVAAYVVGTDQSGHNLLEGGSATPGDYLFMYQLREDGAPLVDADGFDWFGERRAWLHPDQNYELNISFTEPNGLSDISEIEVALADNIASDRMAIIWNSTSRTCIVESVHISLFSCTINDDQGFVAGPFTQDMILNVKLSPKWTMPDFGETRREPMVKITDRSGQEDVKSFPQNRWRFSGELMVIDNVSLWVENGVITEEGARASPSSRIELGGNVVFSQSMESPQFECDVNVKLDGVKTVSVSYEGDFTAGLFAPTRTGQHALTWEIGCLPEQGIDLTNPSTAVRWITVDAFGPEVVEFVSPRPASILDLGIHPVDVIVSEPYGIDGESVELIWWITSVGSNDEIASGLTSLTLDGEIESGLRLEFSGEVDITGLDSEFLQEQLVLKMRLTGRDQAGNQFELSANSANNPADKWLLIHYVPDYSIDSGGVEIAKSDLEVDESTTVQIHVRNSGLIAGESELLIEIVDLNGERELLAKKTVWVESKTVTTELVDWKPLDPGIQWIEVSFVDGNGEIESSRMIDVKPMQEKGILSGVLGDANPWLIGISLSLIGLSLIMVMFWMRLATAKQGVYLEDEEDLEG